ncbi:MAG: hypothetical protein ACOX6E_00465 [Syntrophomonadaceae bacterium]|jgi:hypothetical protein
MRVGNLIIGLLLVLAGEILFLINIGYGSWVSIYELGKWWPLLLIIFGLGIMSKGKINYLVALLIVILSVGAVGLYFFQIGKTGGNTTIINSSISITREKYPDVKQCNLSVNYGAGKFSVAAASNDLLKGNFNNKSIIKDVTSNFDILNVNLHQSEDFWITPHNSLNKWQLWISPELAWVLDINTGAVDGDIDLTGVPLKELTCEVGAGNMNFRFGNNGPRSKVRIEAGASSIKLYIPNDTGVSIGFNGALNANNLNSLGWNRTGNRYTSPNYHEATSKIDCNIDLSLGNLDLQII